MRLLVLLSLALLGVVQGGHAQQRPRLPDVVEAHALDVVVTTDSLALDGRTVIPDSLTVKVGVFPSADVGARILGGTAVRIARRTYRYQLTSGANTLKPGNYIVDVLISHGSGTYLQYDQAIRLNRLKGL